MFDIEQVHSFGEPCYYGYDRYIVLSTLDWERPLKADWKFEQDRENCRPIHRYDRVKRFEWILYQILGYRGIVPEEVIDMCSGCDLRASHIWASIQSILKSNGLRKYYNRIGQIIWHVARLKIYFRERDWVLERIVQEFRTMQVISYTPLRSPFIRRSRIKTRVSGQC